MMWNDPCLCLGILYDWACTEVHLGGWACKRSRDSSGYTFYSSYKVEPTAEVVAREVWGTYRRTRILSIAAGFGRTAGGTG